ncbi:hypothetical protein [Kosmotoga olearia]|uniref:Multiple resistance and pH regulation protein F n=1 Tax=Kosmotoga olearia (strain ATCC BAA-1733 / DSM 21960 / TBF 19.5.1) TaxID=521045 RepID=C5CFW5_KOSOT|nr:hypothetical protein [Kosmotoga olearia]ACR80459.1 hypothetical protein Kole_1774 [Kosmotoga olearia TBF 19.5.1]
MITYTALGVTVFSVLILFLYSRDRNPWKLLVAYSSITVKVLVLLLFLGLLFEIRYLSEIILIFLFLNAGGTIIAAYFLGVRNSK